ncbi:MULTISPECIES: glutaredoxin family protein [Aneurinibacillus]|uniref:Glutaredoxin family protein n=1 Tax=Aneurinibacillus thermoaerophilus TaxID=143495 RepID=A0A1G8CXL2_ANETH|nr:MULTISPECIES: glutaredoxin family protein [Aneurinibacillus]AMA74450.1 NrdH-redoxin [Aneurinibacillus sp. XH2]MED0675979.1 glutaredoxin family protein [Aneurinibacillus thermoaerophilus]MED0679037.1 glutaredoxin family protein [Aneurinibacillus thermoaerophilus]MED0738706.1 glutaredoxin family protein [Aneurinibacillus thermoaerophilus]MED0757807.1 glutaredoxin family protein [Aneurinibacillus thermoaerophilus]
MSIIVYSAPGCSTCEMVKNYLKEKGHTFEVRDVLSNRKYQQEVEALGVMGIPVTVINGKAIKGFEPAELDKLLSEA